MPVAPTESRSQLRAADLWRQVAVASLSVQGFLLVLPALRLLQPLRFDEAVPEPGGALRLQGRSSSPKPRPSTAGRWVGWS